MIKFTVELEGETKIIIADKASVNNDNKELSFYNIIMEPNLIASLPDYEIDRIVGRFTEYKNFYINGEDNE